MFIVFASWGFFFLEKVCNRCTAVVALMTGFRFTVCPIDFFQSGLYRKLTVGLKLKKNFRQGAESADFSPTLGKIAFYIVVLRGFWPCAKVFGRFEN